MVDKKRTKTKIQILTLLLPLCAAYIVEFFMCFKARNVSFRKVQFTSF